LQEAVDQAAQRGRPEAFLDALRVLAIAGWKGSRRR
jgi:hypothetical protein